MIDEIGNRYGHFLALSDTGKRTHGTRIILYKCDCGATKEVNVNKLHSGHTTFCGCVKHNYRFKGLAFWQTHSAFFS